MDMIVKSESLTSVADAIRTKGETSEALVFPDGFVTAIMALESGGVSPQLIVTAPVGSTITAVNGDETVTGVIGAEGTLTLDLPVFGTWMVTATLDGQEANTSVYIEQEYPVSLSYSTTFVINGGHNETVTIKEGEKTLETVVLDNAGTGSITIEGAGGRNFTFIGGTSSYSKNVAVNTESEMTVNVYPDGALYWYGRTFDDVTGGFVTKTLPYSSGAEDTNDVSVAYNEDHMYITQNKYGCCGILHFANSIDLSNYSTLVFNGMLYNKNTNHTFRTSLHVWSSFGTYAVDNVIAKIEAVNTEGMRQIDFSEQNVSGEHIIGFVLYHYEATVTLRSMHLE